jgi:recombination associated protein RdgC
MFNNLSLYRIEGDLPGAAMLEDGMAAAQFVPCAPSQPMSFGWIAPRTEGGALLEVVSGQMIGMVQIEAKMLPSAVVKRRAEEMAEEVKKATGRPPGARQRRELKEDAQAELLPRAFTKLTKVPVWIDRARRVVAIDATSAGKCEPVIKCLIAAMPTMNLHNIQTKHGPGGAMAAWIVEDEPPAGFSIDQDVLLQGGEEGEQAVSYSGLDLGSEEVHRHIEEGRLPVSLAMTYRGRVSFTLTDKLHLRAVDVLDLCFDVPMAETADAFDAEVAITTAELAPLIDDLIFSLGGIALPPIVAAQDGSTDGASPADSPARHDGDASTDPLYAEACTVVRTTGRPSISLIQRDLRIGYNRAARLLERMEDEGLVSAMRGDGTREVLAQNDVAASAAAA